MKKAIGNGMSVHSAKDASSPLFSAVKAQNKELVETLLHARVNPSVGDNKGVSPLHLAVFDGMSEIIATLLVAGADANRQDKYGQTPIFFCPNGKTCSQLVAAKADMNALNAKGQSALHLAAHAGLNEAVLYLAEKMNPNVLNSQDNMAVPRYIVQHTRT